MSLFSSRNNGLRLSERQSEASGVCTIHINPLHNQPSKAVSPCISLHAEASNGGAYDQGDILVPRKAGILVLLHRPPNMSRSLLSMNNFRCSLYSGQSIHTLLMLRIAAPIHGIRRFHKPPTRAVIDAVRGIVALELDCETRRSQKSLPPPSRLHENKQLHALIEEDVEKQLEEERTTLGGEKSFVQNYRKTFDELYDILSADAKKPRPSWTAEERRVLARVLEESEPIYQRYAMFKTCVTFAVSAGLVYAVWRAIRFVLGYWTSEQD